MTGGEAGVSGPIEIDPQAWTGEEEGPSTGEFSDVMRSASPEARAEYLAGSLSSFAEARTRKYVFYLVGSALLLAIVGAVHLLGSVPSTVARNGAFVAGAHALLAVILLAAVPLGAHWLWDYIKRSCADQEASVRGRWMRLRAATHRPPDQDR